MDFKYSRYYFWHVHIFLLGVTSHFLNCFLYFWGYVSLLSLGSHSSLPVTAGIVIQVLAKYASFLEVMLTKSDAGVTFTYLYAFLFRTIIG